MQANRTTYESLRLVQQVVMCPTVEYALDYHWDDVHPGPVTGTTQMHRRRPKDIGRTWMWRRCDGHTGAAEFG